MIDGDNYDGPFRTCMKRPIQVQAVQIEDDFKVTTMEGGVHGKPGDYLMKGPNGERYPCDQTIFQETYDWMTVQDAIPGRASQVDIAIPEIKEGYLAGLQAAIDQINMEMPNGYDYCHHDWESHGEHIKDTLTEIREALQKEIDLALKIPKED